jgi:hypothetical protein
MTKPPLVARYLQFACASQRTLTNAMLMQQGVMRADRANPWMPFTAMERFTIDPIGFRWVAWAQQGAFVRVRVSDAYKNGRGASNAKLFGFFTVGSQRPGPELNEASLLRYLAESAWIPPLLGDSRIEWQELSANRLQATLRDDITTASVTFTFGENAQIQTVEAQRYRDVHGAPVLTPWRGHFDDYEPMDVFVIPRTARVEWLPSQGPVEVWRGRIIDARYRLH